MKRRTRLNREKAKREYDAAAREPYKPYDTYVPLRPINGLPVVQKQFKTGLVLDAGWGQDASPEKVSAIIDEIIQGQRGAFDLAVLGTAAAGGIALAAMGAAVFNFAAENQRLIQQQQLMLTLPEHDQQRVLGLMVTRGLSFETAFHQVSMGNAPQGLS